MKKLLRFSGQELKNDFYPLFLNLIKKGCEIEACVLILSTWNSGCFRFVGMHFKLDKFKKNFKKLEYFSKKFKNLDFKTINFDKYQKDIKKIFKIFAAIKGVQKTGAAKLMHLKIPKVFVMWDSYIRKHYGFKKGDENDYFDFLKKMRHKFQDYKAPSNKRTLAKYIDEHNYITITAPILRKKKRK